jgi:hypothetical protein
MDFILILEQCLKLGPILFVKIIQVMSHLLFYKTSCTVDTS